MPETQTKETKKSRFDEQVQPPTLARIVGEYLPMVMLDRTNMVRLEKAVADFISQYYDRTNQADKVGYEAQMMNARLAIESLYNTVKQQL